MPGRLPGRDARGGEGGGGEAAAVNFVPHVVAWNLTRRCNLECAHCYIAAGPRESAASELETAQCLRIVDELVALNPAPLLILSGGEPLLRDDLTDVARYASRRGATVVVGTNGTLLTDGRVAALERAGGRGVAGSVDSPRPSHHDKLRPGPGSPPATQAAPGQLRAVHQADPASPVLNSETRCPCGTQYCRITPDGKVTPCPYLPEVAGDLATQSFTEIWRSSPLFRRLREGTLGGKCGACEYRKLCGGCRARAFALAGDVLAADPSCAYEPPGAVPVIERLREVTYGAEFTPALVWSDAARARIERIPSFVRGVVMHRVEEWARRQGRREITPELLAEVRSAMPVDFAKRRPFFVTDV